MRKSLLTFACLLAMGSVAQAQNKPAEKPAKAEKATKGEKPAAESKTAAAAPDMSKMPGPMSRKVTKKDTKGIDALFKAMEDGFKKGDINAVADLVDFPVVMVTDDSQGNVMVDQWNRDQFVKNMSASMQNMPKDVKMKSKHSAHFLSDTLAAVDEDDSMSMGKMHGSWNAENLVVQKDGKWKVKMMAEAGWGDMMKGGPQGATGTTPTSTVTPHP